MPVYIDITVDILLAICIVRAIIDVDSAKTGIIIFTYCVEETIIGILKLSMSHYIYIYISPREMRARF